MKDRVLRRVRLRDEYKALQLQLKSGLGTLEDDRQISARMAAVRAEAEALEPKRPPGRPRVHPVGYKRSYAKGTLAQQSEARALRRRLAQLMADVAEIKRTFAGLAGRGGPSC